MTNNNFAEYISSTQIKYAPTSIKTNTGIIINPPDELYYSKGYYKVIDDEPEAESGCYVKFIEYVKNDENKTITFSYAQIMIPVVKETFTYSKLKLEMNLFKFGKIEKFDQFLDATMIENDLGQQIALRRFYDQAQELKSDNVYFETYLKKAQEALEIDDETLKKILQSSIQD